MKAFHTRQRRLSPLVLLLALLCLWDLRVELQLLAQQFTITALRHAVLAHPLAVAVLVSLPTLHRWSGLAALRSSDPSRP